MRTTRLIGLVVFCGANFALIGCGDSTGSTGTGGGGQGGDTTTTTSSSSSSSSSSSAGGGGGAAAEFTDSCPPEMLAVPLGFTGTVSGSTATATSGFTTFCGDIGGTTPDVVIGLDIQAADCVLEIALTDVGAFDGVLSVRKTQCDMRLGGDYCVNEGNNNEVYKAHAQAGPLYVVVDGANGSTGDFTLAINCSPAVCGDGIVDLPEECDSGPGVTPNDGCADVGATNQCKVEAQLAASTCPGTPISIDLNQTAYFPATMPTYSTIGAGDDYDNDGTCLQETEEVDGTGAADQVFAITPTSSGTLTVRTTKDASGTPACDPVTPDPSDPFCVDRLLYIRSGACETGTQIACGALDYTSGTPTYETIVTATVVANATYYLFVDSYWDQEEGPYVLEVTLDP